MPRVTRLRWTPINTAHILRHDVRTNEVQEVVDGEPIERPGHTGRTILIGPTRAGRIIAVVVEPESAGVYFPVTARPASREERRLYEHVRGERRFGAMSGSNVRSRKHPVPEFATREEEARFWDTHDLTDYFDFSDFQPSSLEVAGPLSEPVTLHVDLETAEEVKAIARELGVPWDGLLYLWIIERRDAERECRATVSRPWTSELIDETPQG